MSRFFLFEMPQLNFKRLNSRIQPRGYKISAAEVDVYMKGMAALISAGACIYPNPYELLHAGHKLSVMEMLAEIIEEMSAEYRDNDNYSYLAGIPLETLECLDPLALANQLTGPEFAKIIVKREFSDGAMHTWHFDSSRKSFKTFIKEYRNDVQASIDMYKSAPDYAKPSYIVQPFHNSFADQRELRIAVMNCRAGYMGVTSWTRLPNAVSDISFSEVITVTPLTHLTFVAHSWCRC